MCSVKLSPEPSKRSARFLLGTRINPIAFQQGLAHLAFAGNHITPTSEQLVSDACKVVQRDSPLPLKGWCLMAWKEGSWNKASDGPAMKVTHTADSLKTERIYSSRESHDHDIVKVDKPSEQVKEISIGNNSPRKG